MTPLDFSNYVLVALGEMVLEADFPASINVILMFSGNLEWHSSPFLQWGEKAKCPEHHPGHSPCFLNVDLTTMNSSKKGFHAKEIATAH